jgi:mono/diheme cytochrome c family protein
MTLRVPLMLRIGLLVVGTTALYTYIGQLVPQKEVAAPVVLELPQDISTQDMIPIGQSIFQGKGLCSTCHTIGKSGALRFPDLSGVGARAATRISGLSDVEYLGMSLYEPNAFIVPGFNPGMPTMNKPPIDLTDQEILTVIAYLQSLGGTPSVTMQTKLKWAQPQGGGG